MEPQTPRHAPSGCFTSMPCLLITVTWELSLLPLAHSLQVPAGGSFPPHPRRFTHIYPSLSHQVPARGCSIFIASLFPTPGPLPQYTELKHSSSSRTMLAHRLSLRWMNGREGRSLFWMDTALWMDARLGKWRVGGISAPTHLLCQVSLCSVQLVQLYRAALCPPSPLAVFHPFTSQPKFVLLREAPL